MYINIDYVEDIINLKNIVNENKIKEEQVVFVKFPTCTLELRSVEKEFIGILHITGRNTVKYSDCDLYSLLKKSLQYICTHIYLVKSMSDKKKLSEHYGISFIKW